MKPFACALLVAFVLGAWGCGPTEETTELTPMVQPDSTPAHASKTRLAIESHTDTVTTTREIESAAKDVAPAGTADSFSVQIGAFKDPKNAARAQTLARERYREHVFSDFNPLLGLYQIRIGVFGSHAEAAEFLHRIQREYSLDYKESWVTSVRQ